MISGQRALLAAQYAAGVLGANLPQSVGTLREPGDCRHWMYLRPSRFGEAKVVLEQSVLGAVAAAGHARPAFQAAGPGRAGTTEERVGNRLARRLGSVRAEEHPDRSRHEGVTATHVVGDLLEQAISVGERRVLDHTEHPLRLLVMRHQFGAPIGDVRPLLVVEERLRRYIQRVGVVQRSTAHAGAGQDHAVLQQVDALDAVAAQLGSPQELTQVPRCLGEVLIGVAGAGLEYADPITLFGQPQRRDTAPKARTDDQDVVVRFHRTSMYLLAGNDPAIEVSFLRPGRPSEIPC